MKQETKISVIIHKGLAEVISRMAKSQGVNEKRLAGYFLDKGFRQMVAEEQAKQVQQAAVQPSAEQVEALEELAELGQETEK